MALLITFRNFMIMKLVTLQLIMLWTWQKQRILKIQDTYEQLLWYTRAARELNSGSNIVLELVNENNRFHRIFISWGACIDGFRFIRPMIFIDDTFLKTKYKGCLLAATRKNVNQELYPIAYAFVDAENGDNCLCFLKCLRDAIGDSCDINFISDRYLGSLEALPQVFPNSANFNSNRHLKDNLKGHFNGKTYKGLKERIVPFFKSVPMLRNQFCSLNV